MRAFSFGDSEKRSISGIKEPTKGRSRGLEGSGDRTRLTDIIRRACIDRNNGDSVKGLRASNLTIIPLPCEP